MFATRQLAVIAVLLVAVFALCTARPEGDASIAPPRPVLRDPPAGAAPTPSRAEAVFAARYAAVYERGLYPGLPVTVCEAKLLECQGLDYAACRETCRRACGLD